MKTELLISHLQDALDRYSKLPFEIYIRLDTERMFEEIGCPSENQGNYCQIEIEILDSFIEDDVTVLHVPITARDESRVFSTDLFIYQDGRIRCNKIVYEFGGGKLKSTRRILP